MDICKDFERVFREMVESEICIGNSLLYVCYASILESKGKLHDAHMVYQSGVLRSLFLSPQYGCLYVFLAQIGGVWLIGCFKLCHNTCTVALLLGMPNRSSC
jgi:hypothetical protein